MVRTFITEKNAKIDVIHIYREKKKSNLGTFIFLGFQISPCATSLEGEFPENKQGFPCVIVQCMLYQITKKNRVS